VDTPNKTQSSINERLNFLIKSLNMSARAFSTKLGVSDSNTRNYLSKNTKPSSDYLESIAVHFSHVSLNWLITGQGEPFLSDSPPTLVHEDNATYAKGKNFSQNLNSGINTGQVGNSTRKSQAADADRQAALERENELLRAQLADKERTIQILMRQLPNA
jgi:transcriptional regulator with XRE-family HTH domain